MLHNGFEKALGDLAGRKARHLGPEDGLNELAGRHADSGPGDDFRGRLEDAIGVLIKGNSN